MSKADLYSENGHYYSNVRWDVIDLVSGTGHRILDVGCGDGATLLKLKELGKADKVFGIEMNKVVTKSLETGLDGIINGDVEELEPGFEKKYFDYIIFADILEHLLEPNMVLRRYHKYLNDSGYVIASIPNIKYYRTLSRLILFDEFQYADHGLLDRSHLRFFTRKQIRKIFEDEGYEIVRIEPNLWPAIKPFSHFLPGVTFLATQYVIKARKAP